MWKPIVGYPWYEVSNKGRVKALSKTIQSIRSDTGTVYTKNWPERILSYADTDYPRVTLTHETKPSKEFLVHRLVARAFLGKAPKGKKHVLHKDDNPTNNISDNLKWGSHQDNMDDKVARNRAPRGSNNRSAILIESEVRTIKRQLALGCRNVDIAAHFGISSSIVSEIKCNKTWSHIVLD